VNPDKDVERVEYRINRRLSMTDGRRIFTATVLGLFCGFLTWLMISGESSQLGDQALRTWGIFISRGLLGCLIVALNWEFVWWGRGILLGLGIDLGFWLLSRIPLGGGWDAFFFAWDTAVFYMLASGLIFGVFIALYFSEEKRVKSTAGWGLFYGVITWLLFTAITNDYSADSVRGMILSRALLGVLLGAVAWKTVWWLRGLAFALGVDLFFWVVSRISLGTFLEQLTYGWARAPLYMLVTGLIVGLLIQWTLHFKARREQAGEDAS
jgi:hypothetical protein